MKNFAANLTVDQNPDQQKVPSEFLARLHERVGLDQALGQEQIENQG
jgi:hypothetical protein